MYFVNWIRGFCNRSRLYSVTPQYKDGELEGKPFMKSLGFGDGNLTRVFDISEIYEAGLFNLTSGSVYFRINNNVNGNDLRFWQGDSPRTTSVDMDVVYSSRSENFTIRLTPNVDGTYPDSLVIGGLQIGTNQRRIDVPMQEYKLDHQYVVTVYGSNSSNMVLSSIVDEGKVDLDKIFGLNN